MFNLIKKIIAAIVAKLVSRSPRSEEMWLRVAERLSRTTGVAATELTMVKAPETLAKYVVTGGKVSKAKLTAILAGLGVTGGAATALLLDHSDDLEKVEPGFSTALISTLESAPTEQPLVAASSPSHQTALANRESVKRVDLLCRSFGGFENALAIVSTLRLVTPEDFDVYKTLRGW